MIESRDFLAAICADPDDDTTRLVYADWLEDHGDALRAEFIRTQVELARMAGDDPRQPMLARRESCLRPTALSEWYADCRALVGSLSLSRGFVAEANCSGRGMFASLGRPPLSLQPITWVWLSGKAKWLRSAAKLPHLARVRDLGIFSASPSGAAALLASPSAGNISGLYLQRGGSDLLPEWANAFTPILRLPQMKQIRRLGIFCNAINREAITELADLGILQGLDSLTLYCRALRNGVARRLAESKEAAGLRTLRLVLSVSLGDEGVARLAASPHLSGLTHLSFWGASKLTLAGIQALAASPYLRNLTDLDLRDTNTTQEGVQALIESPNLPRLARLLLADTPAMGESVIYCSWASDLPHHQQGVIWVAEARHGRNG